MKLKTSQQVTLPPYKGHRKEVTRERHAKGDVTASGGNVFGGSFAIVDIYCFSSAFLETSRISINCENYCTPPRTLINQNHFTIRYFPFNVISLRPGEEEVIIARSPFLHP